MTYPNTPGHAPYSDTSRAAADGVDSKLLQKMVLAYLVDKGLDGATADELAVHLESLLHRMIAATTAGARLVELERAGKVSKTPARRKTRTGRNAVVYIAGLWVDHFIPKVPDEALHRCETASMFGDVK